jgi:hypothetical protein
MENKKTMLIPTTVLTVFVILKLTGNITWPWWMILSPLWIGAIVSFIILFAIGIVMILGDEYRGHEVYNKEFGCVLWCQKCLDSKKES